MRTTERLITCVRENDAYSGKMIKIFLYEYADFRENFDGEEECYNHTFLVKCDELDLEEWYDNKQDAMAELNNTVAYLRW